VEDLVGTSPLISHSRNEHKYEMNKAQTAVAGDERRGRAHGLYLGCLLNLKGLEHPHQVVQ
jgi:hypothetical protein